MSSTKPVVVYGASGYTGRLVCEYLREMGVPFVAAGRDKARLQEVIEKIPGIETVEHEVVEVAHEVGPLTELFYGASVVCNIVGPFIKHGPEVAEASLAAGCHYLDTTGEQDWALDAQSRWGARFAEKGLLLAPCVAHMYTTGEIAANICLETPGVDTLDILVLWKGFPTQASTQTIFTILKADWFYLEQNQYQKWDPQAKFEVVIPGQHETALAVPWGGTSHPGRQLQGDRRRAQPDGHGRRRGDGQDGRRADQDAAAGPAGGRACRDRQLGAGRHAAAGEPAGQHLPGLGLRVGPAGPGALRDSRQLQLQADRGAAGACRLLAAAAAAEAGRVRLCLPGVRAPRAARRAAQLRAGHGARPDRAYVTSAAHVTSAARP